MKSPLPAIKPTGHQVKQINLGLEFGSMVNGAADLFAASKALRRSSLSAAAAIYVETRKRVAPNGAMLSSKSEKGRNERRNS